MRLPTKQELRELFAFTIYWAFIGILIGSAILWHDANAQFTGTLRDHPSIRENNEAMIENNPATLRNNEAILENSKYGNRVIRDNDGEAVGYIVPKEDGGINIFSYSDEDSESERIGYSSSDPITDTEVEDFYDEFFYEELQ